MSNFTFPKTEYFNVCKIVNSLVLNSRMVDGCTTLSVSGRKPLTVSVSIYDDNDVLGPRGCKRKIDEFDLAVMDAVYSICCAGSRVFSLKNAAQVLCGCQDFEGGHTLLDDIEASISRLSCITATIECTEQLREYRLIGKNETCSFTGNLLSVNKLTVTNARGQTQVMYELLQAPVLHRYAGTIRQMACCPTEFLPLKKRSASGSKAAGSYNSSDSATVKRYLFKQIQARMRDGNSILSDKISYEWYDCREGIYKGLLPALGFCSEEYKAAGRLSAWRKKKSAIHAIVLKILDDFVDSGFIEGYTIDRDGPQKITGVRIRYARSRNPFMSPENPEIGTVYPEIGTVYPEIGTVCPETGTVQF